MSEVTINFAASPVEISSMILGKQGEHNATTLIITPTAEMTANDDIKYYGVTFQIGAYKKFTTFVMEKSETLSVPLERDATQVNCLSIQLEAYDGKENLLIKSEKIDGFVLLPSVVGDELQERLSSGTIEQVSANTEFRKNFSEDSRGGLLYKGESIVTSESDRPTAELILNSLEGYATYDRPTSGSFIINDAWYQLSEEDMPLGTEIKKVELSLTGNDDDWIDINDMYTVDGIPYHISASKVFTDVDGIKAFAMATNMYAGDNYMYNIISNGNDPVYIKITYYID